MQEGTSFCNQFGDWNPTRHMAALMTMLHRRPARAGNNIIVLYKFLDFVSNLSNLYIDLLVWDEWIWRTTAGDENRNNKI